MLNNLKIWGTHLNRCEVVMTNESNAVSNLTISGSPCFYEANDKDEIVDMLKTFWETESSGI